MSEAVEGSNPDRPHTVDVDAPIALHEDIEGVPYTAKYFEVEEIWNDKSLEMGKSIRTIEKAYREAVEGGRLSDGRDSYKAFINEAIKATDTKHAPDRVKIAKIAEFVKFMSRLEKIEQEYYG